MLPNVWGFVRPWLKKNKGVNLADCRYQLLLGRDMLWAAWRTDTKECVGAVITSIWQKPPEKIKNKRLKGQGKKKTLRVHLAGGKVWWWIDSAVERIARYGHDHKCKLLFLIANAHWRRYSLRFWSPEWDRVAISRDKVHNCRRGKGPVRCPNRNRVGFYRVFQLVEKMNKQQFNTGTYYRFEISELF